MLAASISLIHSIDERHFFWASIKNSGHALVFFQFTYFVLGCLLLRRTLSTAHILVVCLTAFTLGIVIEFVQPLVGRQASLLDAFYNLLGCAAAGLCMLRHQLGKPLVCVSSASMLLAVSLIQPGIYGLETQRQRAQLPTLLDWEQPLNRLYWQPSQSSHATLSAPPRDWPTEARQVARIDLMPAKYPGISLQHLWPNWTNYKTLEVELWSKEKTTFDLVVRIHDNEHNHELTDRYNRAFTITPGLNRLSIPLTDVQSAPATRSMQLDQIAEIILFAMEPVSSRSFYLGPVRLDG